MGGFWIREAGIQPRFLAVEMLAQAAAVLLAEGARGVPGYLAGIEEASWSGDFAAGDDLEVRVAIEARLGALAKIQGALWRGSEKIFSCRLIVRSA